VKRKRDEVIEKLAAATARADAAERDLRGAAAISHERYLARERAESEAAALRAVVARVRALATESADVLPGRALRPFDANDLWRALGEEP
jgi:hypothetical protein